MRKPKTVAPKSVATGNRYALIENSTMILLIVLSMIGISIMDFSPSEAYQYWVGMIPVFGIGAVIIHFAQAKQRAHIIGKIFIEQFLLWFGVLLAVCGTLILLHVDALDNKNTGLVMLLVLSLATYIDGLRIGWRFSLIGNFLGLTAVLIAYLENFMWILFGLAIITIGVAVYWDRYLPDTKQATHSSNELDSNIPN